jgi:hypothetical protein
MVVEKEVTNPKALQEGVVPLFDGRELSERL